MLQLACAISTRNVSAYGLVTTRLYCSGNWRIASARGRGAAAGGIKPKSGQYVGSASRVSCFFAPLEAAPGPRPLLFDLRPGIHAIGITYPTVDIINTFWLVCDAARWVAAHPARHRR